MHLPSRLRIISCTVLTLIACHQSIFSQLSIIEVLSKPVGSVVTFAGVAINGSELGEVRYVQDGTAAIAVFPGSGSQGGFGAVRMGDSLLITGLLTSYHGLLEVSPVMSFEIVGSNFSLEPAETASVSSTFDKISHGRRFRLQCLRLVYPVDYFDEGNHPLYDSEGVLTDLFIDRDHVLFGKQAPQGAFDLRCIASYYDKPRLLVSEINAIEQAECISCDVPLVTELTTDGICWKWNSTQEGIGLIRYGLAPGTLQTDTLAGMAGHQPYEQCLAGLDASTVMYMQGGVLYNDSVAAWSPLYPFITSSASSGDIRVYFNNSVDSGFPGPEPDGTTFTQMRQAILDLIGSATQSIDMAAYNINRDDIVDALEQARAKGVRVRYIADGGLSNQALDPLPGFPVFFRNGSGLMHNKFIVVDPDNAATAAVWTGSTNFTTNQMSQDPNNAIHISDQSLARIYQMEFEEMWGGNDALPNPINARFGSAKYDNTPKQVSVNGTEIEVVFSPSDHTTYRLKEELNLADATAEIALLILTREDIAHTLVEEMAGGVDIRGMYEDGSSSPGALQILAMGNVDFRQDIRSSIFHHKYAIIDAEASDPVVITGSHNWTNSAEVRNDENTLIIRSRDIARTYRKEFEERWDDVSTDIVEPRMTGLRCFPNPFTSYLLIDGEWCDIQVVSSIGEVVRVYPGCSREQRLELGQLSRGMYFLTGTSPQGYVNTAVVVKQ